MQEIINFVEYDNIDVLGVNSRRCHNYIPQSKELNEFFGIWDTEMYFEDNILKLCAIGYSFVENKNVTEIGRAHV